MSTYFALKDEHTRKELEDIGVLFLDGEIEHRDGTKHPHVWIVSELPAVKGQTQYLHPSLTNDGLIYGFTRYGANDTYFLTDLLDENLVDWVDEYSLSEMGIPLKMAAEFLGIELTEENRDALQEAIFENFCDSHTMYFEPNKRQFVLSWLKENKEDVLKSYQQELETCD